MYIIAVNSTRCPKRHSAFQDSPYYYYPYYGYYFFFKLIPSWTPLSSYDCSVILLLLSILSALFIALMDEKKIV